MQNTQNIPYDHLDRRDPKRFFDAQTDYGFDYDANCLITPAFRVEYFEQVVQFNKVLTLELDTPDPQLVID